MKLKILRVNHLNRVFQYSLIPLSLAPYFFLSFLNVDPMHDGWFTTPAVALADGAVPYRDIVTSYGWFTPAILSLIYKVVGFELIALRLLGFILLTTTSYLSLQVLANQISTKAARYLVSAWLWLGIGQLLKDPAALPSWSMWPNQFLIIIVLFFILKMRRMVSPPMLVFLGLSCGLAPWIRAQGILLSLFTLLIAMIVLVDFKAKISFLIPFLVSLLSPVIALNSLGAWDEFIWQTIEMPRTGEWFGMPNPLQWFALNFGIAAALSFLFCFLALGLTKVFPPSRSLFIILVSLFMMVSFIRAPRAEIGQNLLLRKLQSLLYVYTNFNYFLVPVLFLLIVVVVMCIVLVWEFSRYRFRRVPLLDFFQFMLPASLVSLTYYNFGHLWGIGVVLLIAIVNVIKFFPNVSIQMNKTFFVGKTYLTSAVLVSILLFTNFTFRPFIAYEDPMLRFMYGTSNDQVKAVDSTMKLIQSVPAGEPVFFLCEAALYATRDGKYISDNIFYSSIMTYFDRRPSYDQSPRATTKYVLYCPSTNTKDFEKLQEDWIKVPFDASPIELLRRR